MSIPALAKALIAACAPGPGVPPLFPPAPLSFTWTFSMPFSFKASATWLAANMAACGRDSSLWALTTIPPEHLAIVSAPVESVTVMIILLCEAKMCAMAHFFIISSPLWFFQPVWIQS